MCVKNLTPVLYVPSIEECAPFWKSLGFEQTMAVPEGDHLGFVGLQCGEVAIMLQTLTSVAVDMPTVRVTTEATSVLLYLRVERLSQILEFPPSDEVVVPQRTTFYGMHEVGYRSPGGHVVVFSAPEL